MLRLVHTSADSAVDSCISAERKEIFYLWIDTVYCGKCRLLHLVWISLLRLVHPKHTPLQNQRWATVFLLNSKLPTTVEMHRLAAISRRICFSPECALKKNSSVELFKLNLLLYPSPDHPMFNPLVWHALLWKVCRKLTNVLRNWPFSFICSGWKA